MEDRKQLIEKYPANNQSNTFSDYQVPTRNWIQG
jgi:hypothetical protein